jgi:hypothetical protein
MQFLNFDLGDVAAGAVAVVTLRGVASNVMLMHSSEVHNFAAGRQFQYKGGFYRASPVRLKVPSTGRWNVIVQPKGGQVSAKVHVLR